MRISVWQQFSSNHSSHFTVVGRFGSESEAEQVATQLRGWMTEILWGEHSAETQTKFSETYGLEWYEGGLNWNGRPYSIDEVVRRAKNDVYIVCTRQTYDTPVPFVGLMWKLGARKAEYAEGERVYLCLYLTCKAPDEETAEAFCNHTFEYLKHNPKSEIFEPLWEKGDDIASCEGIIWREGLTLKMRLQFFRAGEGIPTLVNYLEQHGYTDIEYTFFQDTAWGKETIEMLRQRLLGKDST